MRKLIRQYEEKNKIIEQIQKNLRMVQPRVPKPNLRLKPNLTNQSFQLDLPTINVRHDYTPKSHSNPPQKKHPYSAALNEQPEQVTQKVNKKQNKPWIQTISFRGDNQRQNKHILLINHRTTLRNFMKTQRQQSFTKRQKSFEQNKEIFLSPSKILLSNKMQKLRETQKFTLKQIQKDLQPKMQVYFHNSHQITNPYAIQQFSHKNINLTDFKMRNTYKSPKEKKIQDYVQQQMQKKLQSKLNQNQLRTLEHRQIDNFQVNNQYNKLQTLNTVVLSPNTTRYRRGHKKNKSNNRSCSPWNLQTENGEINQIWNMGLEM